MRDTASVKRPGSVTAVAVMGFILGGGGLFGIAWVIVQLATGPGPGAAGFSSGMLDDPVNRAWILVSVPVHTLMSAAWIFTSVGLLRMRRLAKTLAVVLLIAGIVMDLVGAGVAVSVIRRLELSGVPGFPPASMGLFEAMIIAAVVGSLVLWLAYRIVMLVLITRRKVVDAFERAAASQDPSRFTTPPVAPPPLPPSA